MSRITGVSIGGVKIDPSQYEVDGVGIRFKTPISVTSSSTVGITYEYDEVDESAWKFGDILTWREGGNQADRFMFIGEDDIPGSDDSVSVVSLKHSRLGWNLGDITVKSRDIFKRVEEA